MTDDQEIIKPGYTRISAISSAYAGYYNIPRDVLDLAAYRGTEVHRLIQHYLKDLPGTADDLKPYLDSFHKFWMPYEDSRIIALEERIYNEGLLVTGKLDLLAEVKGVITLMDWKCTYKTARHWAIQASGYHYIASAAYPDMKIDKIEFVRLRKDGKFPEIIEYEIDHDLFLNAHNLYVKFMKDQENHLEDE
jgi:hypothetical protein